MGPLAPEKQKDIQVLKDVPADQPGLVKEIQLAKIRFGLPLDAPVQSCYEAGRDGFWLDRWLITRDVHREGGRGYGERGIRTPGTLPGSVVFKTTAIDHSAISPHEAILARLPLALT